MTYPLAYPIAPTNGLGYCLQSAAMGGNSGNDSSAFAWYTTKASRRAGRAAVVRHRRQLSERDMHVIGSIDRYRYLSAQQIEELHFFDHASSLTGARACRRVLERLTRTSTEKRADSSSDTACEAAAF